MKSIKRLCSVAALACISTAVLSADDCGGQWYIYIVGYALGVPIPGWVYVANVCPNPVGGGHDPVVIIVE